MKKYFCIMITGLLFCNPNFGFAKEKIELAICAIFQDDANYLPEWIEFHEAQGVQQFYLYNNLSSDNYKKVLNRYVKKGLVKIIDWPFEQINLSDWNKIQCSAYMDCIESIRETVKWCAFIDTDEFLFCPNGLKLTQCLRDFRGYAAVGANWMLYGTSHVYSIPKGVKMTDMLIFRAEDLHPGHLHVKSIVNPKHVEKCMNPHFFILKNGELTVTENKVRFDGPFSPTISVNRLRINHYWSRNAQFFKEVKCKRQEKWDLSTESAISHEKELNVVFDPLSNYIHR